MSNILEVRQVEAGYGKSQVLFGVSAEVRKGSITAILGPNGSGKSTLLKTIFGLTEIYQGSIGFNGIEIRGMRPHRIARLGIAYLPQVQSNYLDLNVRENLLMAGYVLSKEQTKNRMEEVLEILPILTQFSEKKVSKLSGGERQILVMAMALMRQPELMLFDEPSAHLAPKASEQIFEKITELRQNHGITIVLVEQDTRKALQVSDQAYLLVSGRVNFRGAASELAANTELGELFLGL